MISCKIILAHDATAFAHVCMITEEQRMKVNKIIFATGNADKMREIQMIMADLGMEIQSMKEAGIDVDIV